MTPKLIIFDWDDVFTFGSTAGYLACYHAAVTGVGVQLSSEEERRRIESQWGKPHTEELRALLLERPHLVDQAASIYENHLFGDTFVEHLSIAPGSADLLSRLRERYRLALVTGVHPLLLKERIFPIFGVPDAFDAIRFTYDLPDPSLAKPHPYSALELMRTFSVSAPETLVVGDAESDMRMALNSGSTPIAVLTGHLSVEQARELGVDLIIPSVTDIDSVLGQL